MPQALVGVQAQDMAAAELAFRARTAGCTVQDVRAAVTGGAFVVTWTLRGTRHLHAAEDVRWLVGLLGPVFGRPGARDRQLGIAGEAGERAVAALGRALEAGPLSRDEVREVLARLPLVAPLGVDVTGQAPIHIVQRAARAGVLCILPAPGRPAAEDLYVLLDDWVPPAPAVAPEAAAARLAARFRTGYWPATAADFRAWSGLPAALARAGWAAAGGDTGPAAPAREPVPVRLAGAFDPLLLGYADRSALLAPGGAPRINAGGGMVRPVVYADGLAVATWGWSSPKRRSIAIAPFGEPPTAEELAAEIEDVERFLAATDPGQRMGK